jgi:signal recognition particle subunit SRP54
MADMMKKLGKGGMKGMAQQMAGMGGGGLGGMLGGAPDPAALLGDAKGAKNPAAEDVDFDTIEKALSGQAPMPPGMGGLPGLGKKK